jgi:hypothetical protein
MDCTMLATLPLHMRHQTPAIWLSSARMPRRSARLPAFTPPLCNVDGAPIPRMNRFRTAISAGRRPSFKPGAGLMALHKSTATF